MKMTVIGKKSPPSHPAHTYTHLAVSQTRHVTRALPKSQNIWVSQARPVQATWLSHSERGWVCTPGTHYLDSQRGT